MYKLHSKAATAVWDEVWETLHKISLASKFENILVS